ncbi:hypothetical protein FQA39_LY19340 [Lamprigera yunnana]|nr:hypothetical protein FQA39_LY19340 [Lamprigera yunnana]
MSRKGHRSRYAGISGHDTEMGGQRWETNTPTHPTLTATYEIGGLASSTVLVASGGLLNSSYTYTESPIRSVYSAANSSPPVRAQAPRYVGPPPVAVPGWRERTCFEQRVVDHTPRSGPCCLYGAACSWLSRTPGQFGVPVPRGIPAFTVQEAVEAAQKLGGPVWVVKAQIHAGGRGKGGGVKVAKSIDDVKKLAEQILGMQLITHQTGAEGQKVRRLYIEDGADIQKEYYLSAVTDRATQKVAFIASSEGGMDIEEVAHSTPEKIITVFVDPLAGFTQANGEELAKGIGMPADSQAQFIDICQKLYKCYMDTDASLVEINPLNATARARGA